MDAKLKRIQINKLIPHPDNPRLLLREDVVEGITAQLKESGVFADMHALIVRPFEGNYQILSGHQRHESARRAGIAEVPCWVTSLEDEAALMLLVTCNAQGELSLLEIGIHCLKAVPLAKGGRGKKGGLSAYADSIGKKQQDIVTLRKAGEVYQSLKPTEYSVGFLDPEKSYAFHLAAIHSADQRAWSHLASHLIQQEWSVADTQHWVSRVKEFQLDAELERLFLPYEQVVKHFLDTREFSPSTVAQLQEEVLKTSAFIDTQEEKINTDHYHKRFHEWLAKGIGDYSWDVRKQVEYRRDLEAEFATLGDNQWLYGSWRDLLPKLADDSVALLLTDPPYGIDFQSDYRLDRRKERKHEVIANDGKTALQELDDMLAEMICKLKPDAHAFIFCHWSNEPQVREVLESSGFSIRGSLVWVKNNTGMGDPKTTFAPKHERILHAVKGSPILFERPADVLEYDRVSSERHPTEKPQELLQRLVEVTTVRDEVVADPFGGVASTAAASLALGRRYWSCEIDKDYWDSGKERLAS